MQGGHHWLPGAVIGHDDQPRPLGWDEFLIAAGKWLPMPASDYTQRRHPMAPGRFQAGTRGREREGGRHYRLAR